MLWYLTILSILSTLSAVIIFIFLLLRKEHLQSFKFFLLGIFLMIIDFLVEYTGTSRGMWTYHQSMFFIKGLVPIELMFLFFSAGVLAAFFHTKISKIETPIRIDFILYFFILVTFLHYIRSIYMTGSGDLLYLSITIGLWGLYNISEKNKESALMLAFLAAVLDFVAEKIVIGAGGYSYQHGFDISIPILYALLTLGLLAVLEKMDKLDELLEHPLVKRILKTVGVKREKYKDKFNNIKERLEEKMKEKSGLV
ncbi:MAG: hypothetical protein ACLFQ8_02725 [Candidatus Aenigmatarchaeota archaeon]